MPKDLKVKSRDNSESSVESNIQESKKSKSSSSSSDISSLSSIKSMNENVEGSKLENEFKKLDCENENYYSNDCNKFLLKKEILERKHFTENKEENPYLYPNLNDNNFNYIIANKKEFNDTKYDGEIQEDLEKYSNELAKADFELQPHQAFVKNFMSFQTPYNSLLLYHGLGTGKTCSAIGVCEDMRDYMKQIGTTKRIIIVASENVQENFKLQLFDERKLKQIDGIWNIRSCTGNKLIKEINPMNMKGMTKEKVISQIKNLINTYYIFLGYVQFANYIIKTMNYDEEVEKQRTKTAEEKKTKGKSKINALKRIEYSNNEATTKRI
jgi:hypothetical protein